MPRHQPKPIPPRERLLCLLQNADVSSIANLAVWHSRQLGRHDLEDEWITYKSERTLFDPIQCVRGLATQDYFIVLMHQHNSFKGECRRLQKEIDRDRDKEYKGAFDLVLQRALMTDEAAVAKLGAQIEQPQTEFRQRKQCQQREEELVRAKRKMKLLRSRESDKRYAVNCCQPMPVTSVQEPLGTAKLLDNTKEKSWIFSARRNCP
jgi:hypothetical protein